MHPFVSFPGPIELSWTVVSVLAIPVSLLCLYSVSTLSVLHLFAGLRASPASVSLPSLCLTEVASLLCLSSHLVLSVFLSLALAICLGYYLNTQSLSLWGPLSFPGGICRDLRSPLRARVVVVLLCRGVAILSPRGISCGHWSLSRSCLCHLFSGLSILP